ncbi:MAG: histidine phosphatase family protein [Nibricoccus sp.]
MYGHELIQAIASFPPSHSVAAIMRHAARFPIANSAQPTLAEITPEGAAAAENMGRQITGFSHVRLFHSPVKRCQQTAECLARGLKLSGVQVDPISAQESLGVDYILDLVEAGRLTDLHGEHFVRLWMRQEIPASVIRATKSIVEAKLSYLTSKASEPETAGHRLDLHVTHDWNILILRELMLGLRHEETGWMTFLDGLAFSVIGNEMEVVYRNHRARQKIPWKI